MGIKMKGLKKVLTGALALTMCLGAALTTMAGTGTWEEQAKATLTKTVSYADGLTTPAATFTFDFAAKNLNGRTDQTSLNLVPTITPKEIQFDANDSALTKDTGNVLAGLIFPEGGIYTWTVTEQQSGATLGNGESMDYSKASFDLVVTVAYHLESGTYYPVSTQVNPIINDEGQAAPGGFGKGGADTDDGADYNFIFTNIFSKEGGDKPGETGNEALVISKNVAGNGGDTGIDFTFTLTLDDSVAKHTAGTYTGVVYNGATATSTVHEVIAGTTTTFTLKHGQRLVFSDVPVGTVVNVTEEGTIGYTPAIAGMVGVDGTEGQQLSTGNQIVADNTINLIAFTNTFNNGTNIPTGVFANNLPFIALIGAGILAVALFAVINKRKAMR